MLVAVLLLGCAPEEQPTTPAPTPLFASEEEAFAAAEEVVSNYLDATGRYAAGETQANPLQYVTGTLYESDLENWRAYEQGEVRLVGTSIIGDFSGLEAELSPGNVRITAAVCVDSSGVRIVDSSGNDVTPTEREHITTLIVTFVLDDNRLLMSQSVREGAGGC